METSPDRHLAIEEVEGSPEEISVRGQEVKDLGELMKASADTLEAIAKNALEGDGQKGRAIEKLRESIGESYETLREAGMLYAPVGPVIKKYGDDLAGIQPRIAGHVEECQRLWNTYASLPGDRDPLIAPDEDSPEADENQAKQDAHDRWEAEARCWEGAYEDWWEAFDEAATNIGKEMAGEIKDGWWENWGSDLFEVLNTVLSVVGLFVAIVAIFVSGAWIAALVIGVLALGVTAFRYAHGEASKLDLAIAVVGVIPFGKGAKVLSSADEITDAGVVASRSTKLTSALSWATSGSTVDDFAKIAKGMENLGVGRQLAVSQLLVGSKVSHVGSLYSWINTGAGLPETVDTALDLYDYVSDGD